MKTSKTKPTLARRKLGSEAHDQAAKPRKIDHNFRQSTDIGEDRGSVQSRLAGRRGVGGGKKSR
jgi:hypothetical protein